MPHPVLTSTPLPPIHLLDGGLGTTLGDQHGVVFDDSTPLWSSHMLLSPPGLATLAKVQTAFVANGADVLLSATYQASYEGFARSGVKETRDAARGMRGAVEGARTAFESGKGNRKGKVALGLGAYGATMTPGQEYSGKYDAEHSSVSQLRDWHLHRMEAFLPGPAEPENEREERAQCWANVDLVAFETLPRVDEILAVREVMASAPVSGVGEGKERDFWIACVFPGEGNLLPDGSTIEVVVDAMLGEGKGRRPWGVGINCAKVGKVEGLVVEFERAVGDLLAKVKVEGGEAKWPALVLYPDGTNGEVYNTTTKVWEKKNEASKNQMSWDEAIYGIVQRARERRLWSSVLVGGCCKVTPEDIGRLRARIDAGER